MSNWRKIFCGKITAVFFAAALIASFALTGCPVEETGYTLTVSINPTTGGKITKSPDKDSYDKGEQVVVTAKAESGYTFKNWAGASTETTAAVKITMDSDKTLTANFQSGSGGNIPDDKLRIYVDGTEFKIDGKQIWFNGANTPWNGWNDFGSNWNATNKTWWGNEFKKLKDNGINATRIWINCDGGWGNAINIDNNGNISSAAANHWTALDDLFDLAAEYKIYIMATLTSFDHFKQASNPDGVKWTKMIQTQAAAKSFADNYTKTLVTKYKNNPYFWAIDLMNEPEWTTSDEGGNANKPATFLTWAQLQYFFAYNASVIHANSDILVTVGMAAVKYNADGQNFNGNKVSDSALKAQYDSGKSVLDFWSPHHYDWGAEYYGVPHYLKPSGTRNGNNSTGYTGGYGLDASKPAIIGECSAKGTTAKDRQYIPASSRPSTTTIITDYEYAYNNGWQGVMAWSSNAVDGNGGISGNGTTNGTDLGNATKNMESKYPNLIYPLGK